eukprot:1369530-Pleurochrysis_carterae.AAC.2
MFRACGKRNAQRNSVCFAVVHAVAMLMLVELQSVAKIKSGRKIAWIVRALLHRCSFFQKKNVIGGQVRPKRLYATARPRWRRAVLQQCEGSASSNQNCPLCSR